jgi:nicotinate-nucleotide pyrophosphorylase (carboxylating)
MALQRLEPDGYRDLVRRALEEDLGSGDATSRATIDDSQRARGTLVAKSAIVVAGLDVAAEAFRQLDPSSVVEVRWGDGARVSPGDVIAFVTGSARALLTAERTALNFLQRMSGIATLTARCVGAAAGRITILDTRKTTPTLRALEKYAVRCGGGTNHRQRLDEALLIKDNHKRLAGGIQQAVQRAQASSSTLSLEVEVETLEELDSVLTLSISRILLDNFTTADIREAMRRIDGRAEVEISGGVTVERIPELATTGAHYVSIGALTHSAPAADLSFELEPS